MNYNRMKFSILEFLFYAACATYYPYLVVYLRGIGYSNTSIGAIIAINSVVVVFAQPFWGMVSDWMHSIRKVFILCISVAAILLLTIPLYGKIVVLAIILAVVTFFESALMPLMDSWVVKGIAEEKNISYGSIRLWGSIGFALSAFLIGKAIDVKSEKLIFIIYAVITLLLVIFVFITKIKDDSPINKLSFKELNVLDLFKSYDYIVFIIFATLISIPHRASTIYAPNLIASVGGTKAHLGMAFSVSALSEVPVFLFSHYLIKKVRSVALLYISCVFFILRQILYIYAQTPIQVIAIHLLQGLSFGLFITGTVYYIYEIAPQKLTTTAQALASSVFFGLSAIIGSYGGGWLIDNYGLKNLYIFGMIISISGIIVLFVGNRFKGRIVCNR